ncbi:hypothetical protein EDB81DRAFT_925331 [Dactylonectria macrodidyma]|uniref:Uncharacterized protein n=1 Tax=Dactylonectria macrodidyma TaxID=307937 RepID=A0A9P9JCS6_9HYPO|nr:hypothetical protein EDB81DRAFT_925331 [Dactylonectria macrodidyma]
MVMYYTDLNLTRSSDRLPAHSGIAQDVAPYMSDEIEYSAGLWTSNSSWVTASQLPWFTEKPMNRPSGRKAPTWPWASIDSPILDTRGRILSLSNRFRFLAQYLPPVEIVPDGVSRFGPISHGVIRLRGALLPATITLYDQSDTWWGIQQVLEIRECFGKLGVFSYRLDTLDADLEGPLFGVPVLDVTEEDGEFKRLDGLILRPVDKINGRYQRIDVFWTDEVVFQEQLRRPYTCEEIAEVKDS